MEQKNKTSAMVRGAMIAALYVTLAALSNLFGLANRAIQFRLSEVLCVLPILFPEAIPGLAIGCLISNMLTGCIIWDIIFGSLATFIGAVGTHLLKKHPILATLPPVVSNMIIIPLVLRYAYGFGDAWWYLVVTVGIGEFVTCTIIGSLFYKFISKNRKLLW